MTDDLTTKFPLSEPSIIGENKQKEFISLFGAILRMRNLLSSFDEFAGNEILNERDMQNYLLFPLRRIVEMSQALVRDSGPYWHDRCFASLLLNISFFPFIIQTQKSS